MTTLNITNQKLVVWRIERNLGVKFEGATRKEASAFIDKWLEDSKKYESILYENPELLEVEE